MPGNYHKKHTWMPCEFVYEYISNLRKPGERCGLLTRMLRDGKYLCWLHSPKRVNAMKNFFRTKAARSILKHEKRIKEYKERYNIADAASVAGNTASLS